MVTATQESLASGRLVLAFGCTLLVTGITNTFPVFFPPLLAEFGGSRAATACRAPDTPDRRHFTLNTSTPGKTLPSIHSRNAPPAVET